MISADLERADPARDRDRRLAGCRPVPSNRARQKARQPASPRPRTTSSNPVPSSGESANYRFLRYLNRASATVEIVEPDAISVEAARDGRFVDAKRGVEHVVALDIEQQIAEIVMQIRPGSAVVVEDAVDCIGLIERQVMKAQVAVD